MVDYAVSAYTLNTLAALTDVDFGDRLFEILKITTMRTNLLEKYQGCLMTSWSGPHCAVPWLPTEMEHQCPIPSTLCSALESASWRAGGAGGGPTNI